MGVLAFGAVAWAQGVNPVSDPGDNVDPETGEVVGDDTPDCASPEDVLSSGLCVPEGSTRVGEGSFVPSTASASATATAEATDEATDGEQEDATGGTAELPDTGGLPAISLVSLGLLVAGGLLSRRLVS